MFLFVFLAAALTTNVSKVRQHYDRIESKQLVPMLSEVLRFPTYEHNEDAINEQKAWLLKTGKELGFVVRDAGKIVEIELPAPTEQAPILGLVVHGDVQPVDADAWSFPPFSGKFDETFVYGRGSADDKGPLVQALLAMKALKESGVKRTHTIRLLVGSREESDADEMPEYLKTHSAPDYSLVLDSAFPLVIGEKAWNALSVSTTLATREGGAAKPYDVAELTAGLAPSIVPDNASITLQWKSGTPAWDDLLAAINKVKLPEGTRVATRVLGDGRLQIVAYGHSAHAGVNIEGGRNALVALARAMENLLPASGANDLLTFARIAGEDIYGTGFGFTQSEPIWGRYAVNVATIKVDEKDPKVRTLTINIRSTPPRTGEQLEKYLGNFVAEFNQRTGAMLTAGGYYKDSTLGFDPRAKIVGRLLDDYAKATGKFEPAVISGGGTYAKRIPNAIAFGMWFPGKPYPGHDVDEKIEIADLQKGAKVLIYALTDIATGARMAEPFK
ncbi:MAG TPA: Sapep family Mn(2+)-dependent dipeptidase [Thermoanaerobaculia bacterium]|nr:Sapep family Mn(2+)-dependent dipeptidase [Thermoanaerobaculia bacterium]